MSLRSGVFTKYVVTFQPGGLRLSSDARAGDLCLDADIRVRMSRGAAGAGFEVKLYDLPEPRSRALFEAFPGHAGGARALPRMRIQLGYLDTGMAAVLDGVCEQMLVHIEGDRRVTTLRGREAAGHACATTPCPALQGLALPAPELVAHLLAQASFPADARARAPVLDPALPSTRLDGGRLTAGSVLGVLEEIAACIACEWQVMDGQVVFGTDPAQDAVAPQVLDRSVNLVAFEPFALALAEVAPEEAGCAAVAGFRFKALGEPGMRPGRAVELLGVERHAARGWRLRHLEHRYNATEGYVCAGVATVPVADARQGRRVDLLTERNAGAAARALAAQLRRVAQQAAAGVP